MANKEDSAQEEQEQQNEQDPDVDKISSSSDFDYDSNKDSDDDSSYYSDESLTYLVCLTIDPDWLPEEAFSLGDWTDLGDVAVVVVEVVPSGVVG